MYAPTPRQESVAAGRWLIALVVMLFAGAQVAFAQPAQETATVRAIVAAQEYATLSAPMSGRLASIQHPIGGAFRKGDILAAFDCRRNAAALSGSQGEVLRARQKLGGLEGMQKLSGASLTDVEVARADLVIAQSRQMASQAAFDDCSIKAPFDGLVSEWATRPYESVREGEPVLRIVSSAETQAKAQVPANAALLLVAGHAVDAVVTETGATVKAVVRNIAPVIEPVSRTVTVIFDLRGSESVRPGTSVTLSLGVRTR